MGSMTPEHKEAGEIARTLDAAQDALNRMRRAHIRGTGCYLTADMIQSLSVTCFGEIWADDDPRSNQPEDKSQ